jgi:Uma2 family endonuclease
MAAPSLTSTRTGERLLTGEEFWHLGEERTEHAELVAGRIINGMPTGHEHGDIEATIAALLLMFVRQAKLGKVMSGEVGLYTQRNPDTVRAADVLFISNDRYDRVVSGSFLDVAPELIVEILSPDDAWRTVDKKLREYFAAGVVLVWIVNPDSRTITAYRSMTDVREFGEGDTLTGDEVLPGFAIPVAEIFEG